MLFYCWPQRTWNVCPGSCRAFLPLIFEGAARKCRSHLMRIGGGVHHHKVFASRFANNARIGIMNHNIVADSLPYFFKDFGGTREMHAYEIRMLRHNFATHRAWNVHHIYNTIRQTCFAQNFHDHRSRINLCGRRFPHYHVAHHGGCCGEIGSNGSKIEGRKSVNEPFERAVLHAVPHAF